MQDLEAVDAKTAAAIIALQKLFPRCNTAVVDMNVVALLDILSRSLAVLDIPYQTIGQFGLLVPSHMCCLIDE